MKYSRHRLRALPLAALAIGSAVAASLLSAHGRPAQAGVFGRGGRNTTRPNGMEAYAFQPRLGMAGAFIKIEWDRGGSVNSSNVRQYVVWRYDTTLVQPTVAGALDTDSTHAFIDNDRPRSFFAYDGDPGSTDAGTRAQFQNIPGIVPGNIYQYQIATAYENQLEDRDFDGQPDTGIFMSPLSQVSKPVTAIAPPRITAINNVDISQDPEPEILINGSVIEFAQTPGADTYVVWLSRKPGFPAGERVALKQIRTVPVDLGGPATVSRSIRVKARSLQQGKAVYITVGARRSSDPKPKPFGAIFSGPVKVKPIGAPPPPPG